MNEKRMPDDVTEAYFIRQDISEKRGDSPHCPQVIRRYHVPVVDENGLCTNGILGDTFCQKHCCFRLKKRGR